MEPSSGVLGGVAFPEAILARPGALAGRRGLEPAVAASEAAQQFAGPRPGALRPPKGPHATPWPWLRDRLRTIP
eukprot:4751684-Pyramimonas_sp.AAC.1